MNYTYVGKHLFAHLGNLNLQPGRFYRTSLKLCVENLCFPPVKSNGFIVLHNYPKIGTLFINIGEQQVYLVFRELLFISKKLKNSCLIYWYTVISVYIEEYKRLLSANFLSKGS